MKRLVIVLVSAILTVGCNMESPTEPTIKTSSRTSLEAIGSMPNPPCNAGLVGVPYPLGNGITTEAGWTCVEPPVVCPAFTVYREQMFLGGLLRYCSPLPGFLDPPQTPTPAPEPTITPYPYPTPATDLVPPTPTPNLQQMPYQPTRKP